MLEKGGDPHAQNKHGDTSLHLAKSVDIMKVLLDGGGDAKGIRNKDGKSVS